MTTRRRFEKPPSFWKYWFGQTVDPKAGEWAHEIVARVLIAMALSASMTILIYQLVMKFGLTQTGVVKLMLVLRPLLSPEWILRRSWKIGLLYGVPVMIPHGLNMLGVRLPFNESPIANVMALAAWQGLVAGLGARSLLACVFGILLGQVAGWFTLQSQIAYQSYFNQNINMVGTVPFFFLSALMAVPNNFSAGMSVWMGLEFSKRKTAEPGNGGA